MLGSNEGLLGRRLEFGPALLEGFQELARSVDVKLGVSEIAADLGFQSLANLVLACFDLLHLGDRDRETVKFHLGDDGQQFAFELEDPVEVRRGDLRLENLGESVEMLGVDSRVVELFLGQDVGAPGFVIDVLAMTMPIRRSRTVLQTVRIFLLGISSRSAVSVQKTFLGMNPKCRPNQRSSKAAL